MILHVARPNSVGNGKMCCKYSKLYWFTLNYPVDMVERQWNMSIFTFKCDVSETFLSEAFRPGHRMYTERS